MPRPLRVRLLHWNAREASAYFDLLGASKYLVEYDEQFRPALMKSWREAPPDAFLIDLSRLPSHGREIAVALRQSPRTRQIPIVFCGGPEEKVNRIRSELPDVCYCTPSNVASTLEKAVKNRTANPIQPTPMMDRYASRTAAQKLGICESSTVALVNAPANAVKILGPLPAGVEFREDSAPEVSVTLCFAEDAASLALSLSEMRAIAPRSKLWVLWRKGGSARRGDVTEGLVRETAIAVGLVDYKICSVNAVWTAMLFACKR